MKLRIERQIPLQNRVKEDWRGITFYEEGEMLWIERGSLLSFLL